MIDLTSATENITGVDCGADSGFSAHARWVGEIVHNVRLHDEFAQKAQKVLGYASTFVSFCAFCGSTHFITDFGVDADLTVIDRDRVGLV